MSDTVAVTIIGGGAVGCAIAYELSKSIDGQVVLIERNARIPGENQSSRNSGVIHAGIYYSKDKQPLKARLCAEGNRLLYEFCKEHHIPYKQTGKLVVAINAREEEYLDDVLQTALENGVLGVRKIFGEEAQRLEPNVRASAALYVPTSGIIEPTALVRKLRNLAEAQGIYAAIGHSVTSIGPEGNRFRITTDVNGQKEVFETAYIINAAGLYADEIAKMINPENRYEIVPVRGEAAKFCKTRRKEIAMLGMNVYPVPHPYYLATGDKADISLEEYKRLREEEVVRMSLGIHLTPTFEWRDGEYVIGRTVTIGPTKSVGYGKEDYHSDLKSPEHFLQAVRPFFPNLQVEDLELHQVGVMAVPKGRQDWIIERDEEFPRCTHLIGIDSPGLTACLAIANHVEELINSY